MIRPFTFMVERVRLLRHKSFSFSLVGPFEKAGQHLSTIHTYHIPIEAHLIQQLISQYPDHLLSFLHLCNYSPSQMQSTVHSQQSQQILSMPYWVAFCEQCFTEYRYPNAPNGPQNCGKCGKAKGLNFKMNTMPVFTAYCGTCFIPQNTHQKIATFAKCPKCEAFSVLKFRPSTDPVYSSSCSKCGKLAQTNQKINTFAACPQCKTFNGLKFK